MKTDSVGVRLIQICKDSELFIGHFTFQAAQGSSLIDYALIAPEILEYVSDFVVYFFFRSYT